MNLLALLFACSADARTEPQAATTPTDTAPDSSSPHDSGEGDTQEDTGTGITEPPVTGDLVISELMIDPKAAQDHVGEWVELANHSDHPIALAGLRLKDSGGDVAGRGEPGAQRRPLVRAHLAGRRAGGQGG